MRNLDKFFLASLLAGGCIAPPTEVVGARKPLAGIETPAPTPEPTPDAVFLDEIKEIQLQGSGEAVLQAHSALILLKQKAGNLYDGLVLRYLKGATIELSQESGKSEVGMSEPFIVLIDVDTRRDTKWFAGTLGHEACHIQQYYQYKEQHPGEPVRIDLIGGGERQRERACQKITYEILVLVGADQSVINYVKSYLDKLD